MKDVIDVLSNSFGLSASEAKVYVACLKLGTSTANEIAYKAELIRTTTYETLKRLMERGLVTAHDRDNIKHFDAVAPNVLMREFQERASDLSEALTQLEEVRNTTAGRPKIEYFSGFKGIRNLLDQQLESNADISIIGKIALSNKFLGPYRNEYIKKRIKKGLIMSVICEPGDIADEFREFDKISLRKTRALALCERMKATFVHFDGKAAIISFLKEDPLGVVIHDKNVADTFEVIFKGLWEQASE